MPSPFAWTPLFPLIGALLSSALVGRSSPRVVTMIGLGTSLLSLGTVIAAVAAWDGSPIREDVWVWLDVGGVAPIVAFRWDGLSIWTTGIAAALGVAVQVHAAGSLARDAAYARFVTLTSLLLAAVLVLFLADNLLVLFVGWEIASLAAYLLTGFWWQDHANGVAARKGFVVARLADVGLLLAMFLLLDRTGTLDLGTIAAQAPVSLTSRTAGAIAIGVLLAVMGRSAQMPLHTGLLAAATGPGAALQPLLALAGPYLIVRLYPVFLSSPMALDLVAAVGALSLLMGALAALGQTDLRRLLAFATTAAFGFVLVGLGSGAWAASIAAAGSIAAALTVAVVAAEVGSAPPMTLSERLRAPVPVAAAFGIAALALFGVPPLLPGAAGDVAGGVAAGAPVWLAPVVVGAMILTFALVRALARLASPSEPLPGDRTSAPAGTVIMSRWTPLVAAILLLLPLGAARVSPIAPRLGALFEAPFPPSEPAPGLVRLAFAVALIGAAGLGWAMFGLRRASWAPPALLARGFAFEEAEDEAVVRPALFLLGEDRQDAVVIAGDGVGTAIRAGGRLLTRLLAGDARWIAASAVVVATIVVAIAELR